jgi:hypothetical protein
MTLRPVTRWVEALASAPIEIVMAAETARANDKIVRGPGYGEDER